MESGNILEEERHTCEMNIRFTPAQHAAILEEAHASGIAPRAYVRQLALSRNVTIEHPIVLDASDIRPAVVQLARIGNNLNQIAHRLNRGEKATDDLRRQAMETLVEVREAARELTAMAGGALPKRKA